MLGVAPNLLGNDNVLSALALLGKVSLHDMPI